MQHLFRRRMWGWRVAVALALAMPVGATLPQAVYAEEAPQQPGSFSTGSEGGKAPRKKCDGSKDALQTDGQCGW